MSALFRNLTSTELVKSGQGQLHGIVVNSHSSGTFQIYDGVDDTPATKATGVFTIATALTPAKFPESVLTSTGTAPANDDTVTIGATIYTFKTTLSTGPTVPYEVLIGASAAAALDNLKSAINATAGEGTTYSTGTVAHPSVVATDNTDTTQKIISTTIGTTDNSLATTEDSAQLSWADSTLGGGTGASVEGVATADATFTIDGVSYYFTTVLSEDHTTAVANEILWATNDATALDNMKTAINGNGAEGTAYSTGTNAHPTVTATTNTNTAQTVESKRHGESGNEITTTDTAVGAAWGGATLSGGTEDARLVFNTFTLAAGSQVVELPTSVQFVKGLYIVVGGTADYTIIYN